jgi:hypothetical protein
MKTAALPSLRVEPELREAAEAVLEAGESLSSFIETSVREAIERRRIRSEFITRGLAARDQSRRSGRTFAADAVLADLGARLARARRRVGG